MRRLPIVHIYWNQNTYAAVDSNVIRIEICIYMYII